jgi:hypothetical protein
VPVSKSDAQGYGSALTYARRYGLCAITGVAPEEDDGNAAAAAKPAKVPGMSGRDVNVEEFNKMDSEAQQWIREQALELIALFDAGKPVAPKYVAANYTAEEKMALWSQLPSQVRSRIKKEEMIEASKPLAVALATGG